MPKLVPKPILPTPEVKPASIEKSEATWLAVVEEKVKTLSYGAVQIVVHDGRVVQVEQTERRRFDLRASA